MMIKTQCNSCLTHLHIHLEHLRRMANINYKKTLNHKIQSLEKAKTQKHSNAWFGLIYLPAPLVEKMLYWPQETEL